MPGADHAENCWNFGYEQKSFMEVYLLFFYASLERDDICCLVSNWWRIFLSFFKQGCGGENFPVASKLSEFEVFAGSFCWFNVAVIRRTPCIYLGQKLRFLWHIWDMIWLVFESDLRYLLWVGPRTFTYLPYEI